MTDDHRRAIPPSRVPPGIRVTMRHYPTMVHYPDPHRRLSVRWHWVAVGLAVGAFASGLFATYCGQSGFAEGKVAGRMEGAVSLYSRAVDLAVDGTIQVRDLADETSKLIGPATQPAEGR